MGFNPVDGAACIAMRAPCRHCGCADGTLSPRKTVRTPCGVADCGRHCYNAPRTETGRERRSLRTRPTIRPSQRTRILLLDNGACVFCHRNDVPLDVGHLISVHDGHLMGLSDAELGSDDNLADDVCGVQLGAVQRDRSASRGSGGAASTAASQRRVRDAGQCHPCLRSKHSNKTPQPMDSPTGSERIDRKWPLTCAIYLWSRLGSNQRPSACEADALPLSHGTGAERRTTSKISTSLGLGSTGRMRRHECAAIA